MTITTVELLACPFCGCRPIVERNMRRKGLWSANCENCGASPGHDFAFERAVERWNTRTEPTLISNLVKENEILRAVLEWVANHAAKLRNGTDDWFGLVEFEAMARDALRSNLDKEEGGNG